MIRSAGSHTKVDLTAFFPSVETRYYYEGDEYSTVKCPCVWFVQCKRGGALSKAEAEAVKELASQAGAKPMHAHSGPNGRGVELDHIP